MSALLLADAKTHLNITVNTYDTELQAIIDSAEATLATRVGPLVTTSVTRRLAGGVYQLALPITPAISLTSVTPRSATALTLTDLYLDTTTGLVTYNNLGPFVAAYYDVVYDAGRATCPTDLLLAVKELVRHLWASQRGSARGSAAAEPVGNTRATGPVPGVAYLLPNRVNELIAPHVQIGVG
jgi:hypothetical protein